MRTLRCAAVAWRYELQNLTRSSLFVFTAVFQPVLFASIAFYLDRAGGHDPLLYSAIGAGLMGIWSTTLFGSGTAIQTQRRLGLLELLVLAPHRYVTLLSAITLATASMGIYSIAATLVWGWAVFGVPIDVVHPLLFAVSLVVGVIALGFLGLVLSSTFVLWRGSNALANLLEYPIWLACGLLVPVKLLPGWVTGVSWVLAPTWSAEAIRRAALGGDARGPIAMCLLLAAVYVVLGAMLLRYFELLTRRRATLALS